MQPVGWERAARPKNADPQRRVVVAVPNLIRLGLTKPRGQVGALEGSMNQLSNLTTIIEAHVAELNRGLAARQVRRHNILLALSPNPAQGAGLSRRCCRRLKCGFNLAAMDWEDFDHLIREIFGKEITRRRCGRIRP